jgi:hypothetical protein
MVRVPTDRNGSARMTTVDLLLRLTCGSPLLSHAQLAELLNRSPDGLRMTLAGDNNLARMLAPAKRRIGRRVYFAVIDVANVIDQVDERAAI